MPSILKAGSVVFDPDAISIALPESKVTAMLMPATAPPPEPEPVYEAPVEPEADYLLQDARAEAEKMLEEARRQIDEMQKNAEESGYREGFAKGEAEAENLKTQARDELENAKRDRENALNGLEDQAVDLIVSILEKFLENAARIRPEIILHIVKAGLAGISLAEGITVRVPPDHAELVSEQITDVKVEPDASLQGMDCLIETPFGSISCGLEQQFALLKEDLYQILNSRKGS